VRKNCISNISSISHVQPPELWLIEIC